MYAVTTPVILSIIVCELGYCLWKENGFYKFEDSVANLGTAVANQVVNVPVHWAAFQAYAALHARFAWRRWDDGWLSWLVLLLGIDFLFYWFHRAGHRVPLLWAAHAPHHSSEELNYTVGARASVTQRAASFLFYWPMALLGFPAEKILPAVALHLLWQLWPHTRAIVRLPRWFEAVFNSPCHHRVHHAINDRYIDKNYGGVLIIWDKLFGSYEPESEAPVYGVKPQLRSACPIEANLQFFRMTWREAANARGLREWLAVWMIPSDWRRPASRAPAPEPARELGVPGRLKLYLALQVAAVLPVMLLVTRHDSPLSLSEKILFSALIWAAALAWGGLMERRIWAAPLETARVLGTLAAWMIVV